MNKNGQTLVMFVIIIPIFIILLAFVVDTGIILKNTTKLNSTTKTILKNTYDDRLNDNYYEKVKKLYEKNNIPTKNIQIEFNLDEVKITNEYYKSSIFGKIIGLKEYKIKTILKIKNMSGKLIIEKE